MALFCVATVCAREPNPEQLSRDALQAQQSGNNELAVQKYQLRTRGSLVPAKLLGSSSEKQIVERICEQQRQNETKAKVISPVLPSP